VKKIIVTGSCGFIGFNLINTLSDTYKIIGIDSLNNAYDNNLKKIRLDKLNNLKNFEFKQINFSKESDLVENSEIFNDCTTIVHLGARAGVRQSFADPEKYLIDNTLGTANLSLKVKEFEIPRFILASTSSIYGDTGSKLAVENQDELSHPPSVYASTKSFGETLAKNILEKTDTIIQIPRFFTVYGPYGRPDMSILRFIHWIFNDEDLILYGDGNQRRSFTYISDIVDGLIKIISFENSGTFNLGSNQTWSLNDVIKVIENSLEKKAKISIKERAYKDVDIVLPSLDRSKNLLNWEPTTSIEDGIRSTVEWYIEHSSTLKNIKFKYDYEQ
tara:strand:- start:557 stop:1549 length:993 start_codon:yes stop_codon:yes gene_type:complete